MIAKSHTVRNNNHTRGHVDEVEALKAEIAELKAGVSTHAHELGESGVRVARTAAHAARAVAGRAVESGRARAHVAIERSQGVISERPLTSVAVAAGVGAAIAGIGVMMLLRRRD